MKRTAKGVMILALSVSFGCLAMESVCGGVDRQLRSYEDEAYSFQNTYFQTGRTIYVQVLGTAGAPDPKLFVQLGRTQIEVGYTETPPNSGIYRTMFLTDPVQTDDA